MTGERRLGEGPDESRADVAQGPGDVSEGRADVGQGPDDVNEGRADVGGRPEYVAADRDAFMEALEDLDRALDESVEMTRRMKQRIVEIRRARAEGRSLREIVPYEETPLIVQLLTESTNLLHSYGNRVRRTEARALHREGMTMDQIAKLFGVTRQRVSALMRE